MQEVPAVRMLKAQSSFGSDSVILLGRRVKVVAVHDHGKRFGPARKYYDE